MAKIANVLEERFRKKDPQKMGAFAEKTVEGERTVFTGLFGVPKTREEERTALSHLLNQYLLTEQQDITQDLTHLLALSAEVKAITNQAILLHGQRIKKAKEILTKYRDGAFTAWLRTAYGNRQTPYNFLQYYELHLCMPQSIQMQMESIPRQALYTLASRQGDLKQKEELIRNYKGESKQEMLSLIRTLFPLSEGDKRQEDQVENSILQLERLTRTLARAPRLSDHEKECILKLLEQVKEIVQKK